MPERLKSRDGKSRNGKSVEVLVCLCDALIIRDWKKVKVGN